MTIMARITTMKMRMMMIIIMIIYDEDENVMFDEDEDFMFDEDLCYNIYLTSTHVGGCNWW